MNKLKYDIKTKDIYSKPFKHNKNYGKKVLSKLSRLNKSFYTFIAKDGIFRMSVKKEFLKKCPKPENYTTHELNSKFFMFTYLHNPFGPAVYRNDTKQVSYWINGRCIEAEETGIGENRIAVKKSPTAKRLGKGIL